MKLKLKKDIVIPAGTVMNCVDSETRQFGECNYSTLIALTPNTCGEFVYSLDVGFKDDNQDKWFEKVDE